MLLPRLESFLVFVLHHFTYVWNLRNLKKFLCDLSLKTCLPLIDRRLNNLFLCILYPLLLFSFNMYEINSSTSFKSKNAFNILLSVSICEASYMKVRWCPEIMQNPLNKLQMNDKVGKCMNCSTRCNNVLRVVMKLFTLV